jgi:type I restriction enzyme M protein
MANEELNQRGYLATGKLTGDKFGEFERLNIGATSVRELKTVGVELIIPQKIDFPFKHYKAPKKPEAAKPDRVFFRRTAGKLIAVAVACAAALRHVSVSLQMTPCTGDRA